MNVFLLWDKMREEHGEDPKLADVYESQEAAEAGLLMCLRESYWDGQGEAPDIEEMSEEQGFEVASDYEIEMRAVKG